MAKVLTPIEFGRVLSSMRAIDREIRTQLPRG
jgi:hypothetical protein